MFERASSTTPTVPPPANLLRQSSTSSLPLDAESLHEADPIAPEIVISPTLSRPCTSASVIYPLVVDDSQDVSPPLDLASLNEPLHEINSPLSQTSDLSLEDLAPQSSQSGLIQQFKARPAPSTTYVPEHKVRQSRASLLRAGIDPELLSTSENSKDGPSQHVPTDFTAVPGASFRRFPTRPYLTDCVECFFLAQATSGPDPTFDSASPRSRTPPSRLERIAPVSSDRARSHLLRSSASTTRTRTRSSSPTRPVTVELRRSRCCRLNHPPTLLGRLGQAR